LPIDPKSLTSGNPIPVNAATEIRPFKIGKTVAQSQGAFRIEIL